jgi:hypothetical protein
VNAFRAGNSGPAFVRAAFQGRTGPDSRFSGPDLRGSNPRGGPPRLARGGSRGERGELVEVVARAVHGRVPARQGRRCREQDPRSPRAAGSSSRSRTSSTRPGRTGPRSWREHQECRPGELHQSPVDARGSIHIRKHPVQTRARHALGLRRPHRQGLLPDEQGGARRRGLGGSRHVRHADPSCWRAKYCGSSKTPLRAIPE